METVLPVMLLLKSVELLVLNLNKPFLTPTAHNSLKESALNVQKDLSSLTMENVVLLILAVKTTILLQEHAPAAIWDSLFNLENVLSLKTIHQFLTLTVLHSKTIFAPNAPKTTSLASIEFAQLLILSAMDTTLRQEHVLDVSQATF